jgi:FMN-dependent oxidoreductase (nitrilotriacetate monooxygenase family)
MPTPSLLLNVVVMGLGMHPGAWRYRDGGPFDYTTLDYFKRTAQVAEKGCLHAMFLADTLAVSEENFERPNLGAMDPTVVLSALAACTSHLGLVATASTTFNEPYNIARRIASLDHISGGRAAWNIVTTFVPDVANNFGTSLPAHDDRYVRAEEFVDIVVKLWESWGPASTIGDKRRGVFADGSKVTKVEHAGAHYRVNGASTLPRTPQVRPVLFQAGSSGPGRELAARVADVVFTAQNTDEAAGEFRADVRRRVKAHGRDPDKVKIMPGLMPILGGTEAEARKRKDELDELSGQAELKKLALRVGVKVSDLEPIDKPMPVDLIMANQSFRASEGFRNAAVRLAKEKGLTVREVLYQNGGGHRQVVGTPEQVADTIERLQASGAADGFNLMIDVVPSGVEDFVAEVVPILQRRGIFRREPVGRTMRESMGLAVPNESAEPLRTAS